MQNSNSLCLVTVHVLNVMSGLVRRNVEVLDSSQQTQKFLCPNAITHSVCCRVQSSVASGLCPLILCPSSLSVCTCNVKRLLFGCILGSSESANFPLSGCGQFGQMLVATSTGDRRSH